MFPTNIGELEVGSAPQRFFYVSGSGEESLEPDSSIHKDGVTGPAQEQAKEAADVAGQVGQIVHQVLNLTTKN